MAQEANTTFQEVFLMGSLTDSIKLSWCVSSAVPFQNMSVVFATTIQQDENIPITATASEPEGPLAPGPSSSPAQPAGTPPPLVPLSQ